MSSNTKKIIDSCNIGEEKNTYNILTFPTHERYETQLCKTNHNFYSFNLKDGKKWNESQIRIPSNYFILPENSLHAEIKYDFILVQSKFWQFQVAQQINQYLHLPIICLEHTIPTPATMNEDQVNLMRQMVGDINVFISEYSQKAWSINYNAIVVHHGVDSNTFIRNTTECDNSILTVANDFVNRDYCLNYSGWKRVTEGLNTKLIGDTKGISESAKSIEELVSAYNSCAVYFNSSTLSPIPTSLLEAMSCGCAVVSTATCMIPNIIQNGINGFISNDEKELRSYIEYLLQNVDVREKVGKNARETIKTMFSEQVFIEKWNSIFNEGYRISKL